MNQAMFRARACLLALLITAVPVSMTACTGHTQGRIFLTVESPPPPPRRARVVERRSGYIWVPGYWQRRDSEWTWVSGYWTPERPGYTYVPGRWVERQGRYVWVQPYWRRDTKDDVRRTRPDAPPPRTRDHRYR